MSRQRVFVSSVVEGYSTFREAARGGILAAGMDPILANEDFPSLVATPRNACLDGIASCDIYLVIVGQRGGWTTPSGNTVVEEEFEFAKKRKMPTLVFLGATDRDASAARLASSLSDYVSGHFRQTFDNPQALQQGVTKALAHLADPMGKEEIPILGFDDFLERGTSHTGEPRLRIRIAPVRDEELIPPQRMGSPELERQLYEIGHSADVHILDYANAKKVSRSGDRLIIVEQNERQSEITSLSFSEKGIFDAAFALPRRQPGGDWNAFAQSNAIPIEDLETQLTSAFLFYFGIISALEPWGRHQQFRMNAILTGLGYRTLERVPQPRSSYPMRMTGDHPIIAFPSPRLISRHDLQAPKEEIERVVALIERGA